MRRSRPRALLLGILCVFAGVTCTDKGLTGPDGGLRGRVGILPSLTAAASQIYQNLVTFGLELDNVHLQLKRRSGELVKDTVIAIGDNTDEIRVEITVQLRSSEELLDALVELRDGTEVLFSGTQQIIARSGQSGGQGPALEVNYIGPGSTAATLTVSPADQTLFTTDSVDFIATALDANEQSVPVVAIAWSVEDAARGTITATGRFKPSQSRGTTRVIAKLPTGLTAFANVSIVPTASQMSLVSGGSQNGTVGSALAQPIVVEVRAGDNLPVPGVPVGFAVSAGGGSLSLSGGTTDASGRASTTLTLGTVAGSNAVTVISGSITPLIVSATGKPGNASKLAILQQPSTSTIAGVPLAVQPRVKVLDLYNNVVGVAGVAVHAAASATTGPQLGGTVTATTDASGVASFSDLVLSGSPGTTSLVFSQDTLGSVTSTPVSVGIGAPATLVLNGASALNAVAGGTITAAPSVVVRDAAGNPVPGVSVRVTMAGSGATLYDVTHLTDAAGGVSLGVVPIPAVAGSYQITAASGSLTGSPIPVGLAVSHAAAAKVVFIAAPSGAAGVAGGALSPIVVELRDDFGNRVTTGATSAASITLSLAGGASGAALGGTVTQSATSGQATFNVSVDSIGFGYTITASAAPPIASTTSAPFDIAAAGSARLQLIRGGEQAVLPGAVLADSIVVQALDPSSLPIAGANVTFSVASGGGAINGASGPLSVTTDVNGRAAVEWTVGTGVQQLSAIMSPATAQIRAYVADRLIMVTEPSLDPQSGITLVQQPRVRFSDGTPRIFRAGQQLVEAMLERTDAGTPSGSLLNSIAVTDADGVATFTQLAVVGPTTEQVRLRFFHNIDGANPDIANAFSAAMNVRPGVATVIEVEGTTDRHRVTPLQATPLRFRVSDGFNTVPNESVNVLLIQGSASCSAQPSATSDGSGIVTVMVTAGPDFSSCRAMAQLQRTIPDGQGGVFQPIAWQNVFAVADTRVPLWVGGTNSDPDPTGWTAPENWFDRAVPQTEPVVFVPAAVDFWPSTKTSLSLQTLQLESGGLLDLGRNGLTLSGSLRGGGAITNAGGVLLTAIRDETVNAQIDGPVFIGDAGKATCTQTQYAYTVVSYLYASSLELNCGLVLEGATVSVVGDLLVQSAGGSLQLNKGGMSVGRDATFKSGWSRVLDGTFSIAGRLVVEPGARLDQSKGFILVEGDAHFNGASNMFEGMLQVNGSFFHVGNGDNFKFVALNPHITQLGSMKDGGVISWNAPATQGSRFGRLYIADRSSNGYQFTNNELKPGTVDVHALYVAAGAQLTVPTFFVINAGGIPGLGVIVDKDGRLMNLGQILVIGAETQCSPLGRDLIPAPFSCLSK